MGVFKGKRKAVFFLTTKKLKSRCPKPILTSTPYKNKRKLTPQKPSPRKRSRFLTPVKLSLSFKSPDKHILHHNKSFTAKSRKCINYRTVLNDSNEYEDISKTDSFMDESDTFLYSISTHKDSTVNFAEISCNDSDSILDEKELEERPISDVFKDVLEIFEKENIKNEFLQFLRLVASGKFPLDNVAFMLFVDVIKWFNSDDVRQVRYNDISLKFFWLGKKLFGGRFIRFMSGPKNETDFIRGKTTLNPMDSKINFACPSESVLSNYNPLGYSLEAESGPGLVQPMIELAAQKKTCDMSYVLMFDGKKIKRGADVDLLGFEDEPISEKKIALENDFKVIDGTLDILLTMCNFIEAGHEVDDTMKAELAEKVRECFTVMSMVLKNMRVMRQSKTLAMSRYKERIDKDPALKKTLQYAIDSCRTSSYQIENCISVLLDVQWEICKCSAYLHGALHMFARSKKINIEHQNNVKLLDHVDVMKSRLSTDKLPTSMIKQRSPEWHAARKEVKVTGSSIYAAVGCDGLKRQNEHFDSVFSNIDKPSPNESQQKAMQHGIDSEVHQIATLAGVVLPAFFPELVYREEGYYLEDGVIVSPDGSLRYDSTASVIYAFEGKAPSECQYTTRQQYSVPERYITQTLYEDKVMKAEKGTLYMCWTPESSTVFIVPKSEEMCLRTQALIDNLYQHDIPKRRTRLTNESKLLKQSIKDHVSKCIFIGEFPSVEAEKNSQNISTSVRQDTEIEYDYRELSKSLLKAKTSMKDAYNIQRKYASQVVVYLLADLDRLWKTELPHAVPVMYCYRGYSLPMNLARNLLDHCRKACTDRGLDVVATSSDGEFIQLMVKGKDGRPLTLFQLSKAVWNEVSKTKKSEIVKCLRSINRKHISIENNGNVSVMSVDGGSKIITPERGWKKKAKRSKEPTTCSRNTDENCIVMTGDQNVIEASNTTQVNDSLDDTLDFDVDELLTTENDHTRSRIFPRKLRMDELETILRMLNQKRPQKWNTVSVEQLSKILDNSMNKLIKDELLDVANLLNITLKGEGKEIRVKKVKKADLVEQIGRMIQGKTIPQTTTRKKIIKNPKRLQDLAAEILMKASYPKEVLNIAYAEYIWPERVQLWKQENRVSQTVVVKSESEDMSFEPYYVPEFDEVDGVFRVFTYDKTHLGTNLRKFMCLNKVRGISIQAWKQVSKARPDILHPSIVEVDDEGRILDQMKESLARTMVRQEVEHELISGGFTNEANFCCVVREGLYVADDVPGLTAVDRCRKRISLINWLDEGVDFGKFPPYGGVIKGLSHILYEGLRLSQEGKMYLYAIAKSGTYCVRAPNTLCSESFFGTMQDMDPWGQGILSSSGVQKHISDFTTITAMKMDDKRHLYMKTKKDAVYPSPKVLPPQESQSNEKQRSKIECHCREEKHIKCIVPRDHFFDTAERDRLHKGERTFKFSSNSEVLRGEQPIRSQYAYKINEARMLPSKRLGIGDKVISNF